MIHYLPMEPTPMRYSADWLTLWPELLEDAGLRVNVIAPLACSKKALNDDLKVSDPVRSVSKHAWEGDQLALFSEALGTGDVQDGDLVLFTEGHSFTPLAASYMRATTGVAFEIGMLLHAGTWDPHDFLNRYAVGGWMPKCEQALVGAADHIFLATEFHKTLLLADMPEEERDGIESKIRVVSYPFLHPNPRHATPWERRGRSVVFPHRLSPEKGPDDLGVIEDALELENIQVIRTIGVKTTDSYHSLLGSARVVLSCALQETWGIAQLEGWSLGAYPVVPDRLSYSELYADKFKYRTLEEAVAMIVKAMDADGPEPYAPRMPEEAIADAIAKVVNRC